MSSNLTINVRALDRNRVRVNGTTLSTTLATPVDLGVGQNRRDLHHYLGRWVQVGTPKSVNALVAGTDTAGALLAWPNPEGVTIIITDVTLNVTTVSTGACTVSAGVAADGVTLNGGMLSGVNVHSAQAVFASTAKMQCTSGQFVTFSTASGASAGLVATAYIGYILA